MDLVRAAPPPDWPVAPPVADGPPTQLDLFPSPGTSRSAASGRASRPGDPPTPDRAPAPAPGTSARDLLGSGLLLIAAVLLALGNVASWSSEVARDPVTYADAEVLDLQDGLDGLVRARMTAALLEWIDLEQLVDDALPGPLGLIGGPTEDLARAALDDSVEAVLGQEPFASTLERLESSADRELVNLLLADSDWFRLDGTTLLLDLDPLVAQAAQRFDELVPDLLAEAVPGLTAAALLPDDIEDGGVELAVGELPVLHEGRSELADLDRAARPLVIAAAAFAILGLSISAARRRGLVIAGLALAGAALAVGLATWSSGAPPAPSTDALREIAGQSFTDADGGALLARSAALFVGGLLLAGTAAALGRVVQRPGGRAWRSAAGA
jgi:hypothetical protein